ncbi:hypothetical protein AVEN_211553-1 [Araneus ventricosus]|uniref:Uncharacterized protein n=1 Tax=Araneus ventricosus TaxID=182803 RepID=A0A4Y2D8F1_ARAVE|nr:hypothetical protein AVEN_211553-1 [Araneus ventricosus]
MLNHSWLKRTNFNYPTSKAAFQRHVFPQISSVVRAISCRRNGKNRVVRGLVSASVVSRVVAVNSSHIKGPDDAIASVHSSAAEIFGKPCDVGTARLFEFHRPQSTSANLERLEVLPSHTPLEQGVSLEVGLLAYH